MPSGGGLEPAWRAWNQLGGAWNQLDGLEISLKGLRATLGGARKQLGWANGLWAKWEARVVPQDIVPYGTTAKKQFQKHCMISRFLCPTSFVKVKVRLKIVRFSKVYGVIESGPSRVSGSRMLTYVYADEVAR